MERELFESRLLRAVEAARRFAEQMVTPSLPKDTVLRVLVNMSFDEHARVGDERVFPDEPQPGPELSCAQAVDLLWRDGSVPEWIDVAFVAANHMSAVAELRCCGRFTAGEELLYHRQKGLPPFAIKSPYLPLAWRSVELDGRFALPRV